MGPENVSVTWASQVFRWLYSDLVIVNELLGTWVQALNDYNKKSLEEVSCKSRVAWFVFESLFLTTTCAAEWIIRLEDVS